MTTSFNIKRETYNDRADYTALLDLLKVTYPKAVKFSREYKKWQYSDNPCGEAIAFNAYDGDRLIAHYCTIPTRMMIGGKMHRGLLSLDTSTHPSYRGKGLFTVLAESTYAYAKEHGYDFVIGVANGNSTPGFLKKLGFYLIAPLDVKVGAGNIFKSAAVESKNHIVYDEEWLSWRLKSPSFDYMANGEVIYGKLRQPFFKSVIGVIPKSQNIPVLDHPAIGFNLYIGIGLDRYSGWYVNLPNFIHRSPFNLIFKDLTGGSLPELTKDNTFFQLLDFDVA